VVGLDFVFASCYSVIATNDKKLELSSKFNRLPILQLRGQIICDKTARSLSFKIRQLL